MERGSTKDFTGGGDATMRRSSSKERGERRPSRERVSRGQKNLGGLTKPEVQRLRKAESMLKDYQDEKLDIYTRQIDEMSHVYEKAHEVREKQKAEYEARQKRIMAELSDMRSKTDVQTKEQLDRLKKFSAKFEADVAKGKREWRDQFYANQVEIGRRNNELDKSLTGLMQALEQEKEDCRSHTAAETGPILEKLRQHRENLEQQIKERTQSNAEYVETLEEHFDGFRSRLAAETSAREKNCSDSRRAFAARFLDDNEQQTVADGEVRRDLADLRRRLAEEKAERESAQATVATNMMNFMEQFEKNIVENQEKQRESQKLLLHMKNAMSA